MQIHLTGKWDSREVWLNGKKLSPARSQKRRNHSHGFNWGYSGSGPAQLALAICIELYGEKGNFDYQQFKFDCISALPQSDFDTTINMPEHFSK